jgi:uncharacterized protein (DUF2249 family)
VTPRRYASELEQEAAAEADVEEVRRGPERQRVERRRQRHLP